MVISLSRAEQASFGQASANARNDQRDGVTMLWQSPAKKRGAPSAQLRADNSSAGSRIGCRTLHSQFEQSVRAGMTTQVAGAERCACSSPKYA
ncbi:MAG: hypothetical protein EOO38_02725 [Cytophagaceae bacterium]|nr:MAG: hypothetical protein EOO38_02725 [Cytophagaceae bacterium]